MSSVIEDLSLFSKLCGEAVAKHGDDIASVEAEVARAIDALPEAQRKSLRSSIERFLGDRAGRDFPASNNELH